MYYAAKLHLSKLYIIIYYIFGWSVLMRDRSILTLELLEV